MTSQARRTASPRAPVPESPPPETIRAAREAAGLSQTEAAALIYCTLRGWQEWEAGNRRMHPCFWEAWLDKSRRLNKARRRVVPEFKRGTREHSEWLAFVRRFPEWRRTYWPEGA